MKKIIILVISLIMFTGCSKSDDKILKKIENNLDKTKTYELKSQMIIKSNEEEYTYDVVVQYKEGPYYKVSLINKDNSYEQIILKNTEGVYVITPSLNKSFKFQSVWPNNSSQSYIIHTLLNDIKSDDERSYKASGDNYTFTTKVNYPNNALLTHQEVSFNKKYELDSVKVYDDNNEVQISVVVSSYEDNIDLTDEYFSLNNNVKKIEETESDDVWSETQVIYPMYIPSGSSFDTEEEIVDDDTKRVILTFTGEKSFILVEETSKVNKDLEVSNVNGELVFYNNILGAITPTSFYWHNNGKDYYIVGQNLTSDELLQIASSTKSVSYVK